MQISSISSILAAGQYLRTILMFSRSPVVGSLSFRNRISALFSLRMLRRSFPLMFIALVRAPDALFMTNVSNPAFSRSSIAGYFRNSDMYAMSLCDVSYSSHQLSLNRSGSRFAYLRSVPIFSSDSHIMCVCSLLSPHILVFGCFTLMLPTLYQFAGVHHPSCQSIRIWLFADSLICCTGAVQIDGCGS